MNWEIAAAVGELIGALAVVVSLIYLAAQIKQNTRSVDEQTRAHRVASLTAVGQGFSGFRSLIASDDKNAGLWEKASSGLANLNPTERRQLDFMLVEMFWSFAMPWLFVQQGVFDNALWVQAKQNLRLFAHDGVREWWRVSPHRTEFPGPFVHEVDEVLAGGLGEGATPAS